jgi:hypothetical protein
MLNLKPEKLKIGGQPSLGKKWEVKLLIHHWKLLIQKGEG